MAMTAADMVVHVGADVKDAVSGMDQVGSAVNRGGAGFNKAGLLMGGAAGVIAGGFGLAINSAMGYEGAMSDVQASLGLTSSQMSQVGDLALQIGRDTSLSAVEAARGIEELGKAGMSLPDILGGGALAAANLAAAVGTNMSTAGTAMATAMNIWEMSGDQATAIADNITAAVNLSASGIEDIQLGMGNAAATAVGVGMSFEQTAAAIALFAANGVNGAKAGTQLNTMIGTLANPTAEAQAQFDALGISLQEGIASGDLMGYMAGKLQTGLGGLSKAEQEAALYTMFGNDAQQIGNILMQQGAQGVADMTAAVHSQGQAQEAANARLAGLRGAMESLNGSVETLAIMFGQMMTPALTVFAKWLTKLVNNISMLSKPMKTLIAVGAGLTAGILAIGAGIAILAGPIGAVIGGVGALIGAFTLVAGIMIALGAAAAILYFGFGDQIVSALKAVWEWMSPVVDIAGKLYDYLLLVATGTGTAGAAFALLPGWLQPIARQIGRVVDALSVLLGAFSAKGLGGLMEVLPGQLSRIGDAFGRMGEIIMDAFSGIDWGAVGSAMWNGLLTAFGYLGGVATTILGYLGDLTTSLGDWLSEQAGKVDWSGKLSAAAATAGNITGKIVEGLGNLGVALALWLSLAAGSVDWSGILSTAAGMAGNITTIIVQKLGNLGASLKTWYDNAINSVDWGNLGFIVGQKVGDVSAALGPKALEMIVGFGQWLRDNWQMVGKVLLGLMLALPATIGYVGLTIIPKAMEFLGGFLAGLGLSWPAIEGWLKGLPGKALAAVPGLASSLLTKGQELISGILKGLVDYWPDVTNWLGQLGTAALNGTPGVADALLTKGQELISGILSGLTTYWPDVANWLANLGLAALQSIPGIATALLTKGGELIMGILQGLNDAWPMVRAWLGLLGSLALAAVGSLAITLLSRGVELIQGTIQGLQDRWPTMANWLKLLGSLAYNAVGSLLTWLVARGIELITGLMTGLTNRWRDAVGQLAGIGKGAYDAVGSLIGTLINRGIELITGLMTGLTNKWRDAVGQLAGIGPGAADAVGTLSDTLYNAGVNLVQGLINGIDSMLGWLADKAAQVADIVKGIPGLLGIDSPSTLAIYWGQMTTKGFGIGLEKGMAQLSRSISYMPAVVSALVPDSYNALRQVGQSYATANNQSSSQVIHYQDQRTFTVKVDDLADVARAVEVIRDLERDHELVYGAN